MWAAANPGFGDLIDPEDFEAKVRTTPENEYRTKRLNQWVAAKTAWLPGGAWEACAEDGAQLADGDTVVIGFDGSFSNDSTVLVAVRPGPVPLVVTLRAWERPDDADGWRVPVSEVEDAIRSACRRYSVAEIVADPHLWQRSLELLADEGLPVVEFPQRPERMIPATQRFYEAVLAGAVAHGDDEVLHRHLRNARTKLTEAGTRVVKESKDSGRKVDAAIAAVMAFDRAALFKPKTRSRVVSLAGALKRQAEREKAGKS